jgi:PAS domain S-box-containing protein
MSLRVLLVEDSPTDAKLIANALRSLDGDVAFDRVEDEAGMRAALEKGGWDVVISDWTLPRFSGLHALQVALAVAPEVPFVIVSGTVGEDVAVEAMRAGARDYVLKDRLGRLAPAIAREMRERTERAARRSAERALDASERRFTRLAESGIIGIVISDVAGPILDANDAFLEMLGFERADLVAGLLDWVALTPSDSVAAGEVARAELRQTGAARPWEAEVLRKDGARIPILLGVSMLEGPRCIAFTVDLTKSKRVEASLRETENQLRQAQKMEAVGRLAGGIAHDFNNLLSVILSCSELALGELSPHDPLRHDVEEIQRAGERAAGLTRQLLLFSRQQVVQPERLDLGAVLANMAGMLRRLLGEDVALAMVSPPPETAILADRGSIEQVVMNLVVNARDAMPIGGSLTIEVAAVDYGDAPPEPGVRAGTWVRLAVTDTGIGMDAATQARIFEPFWTTKEVGRGTGLGLSTVFGIVEQGGGWIQVRSEVGRGTTFEVHFPPTEAAAAIAPAPAAGVFRGTETILLVEDDAAVRGVARAILRRNGYTVIEAGDADEAVQRCAQHAGEIHLLLTDVVMPGVSGIALAERLRAARPAMKVLCMSGYTDDSIVRHGVLTSDIPYLQKPITPETLARKIREVLGRPDQNPFDA